MKAQVKESTLAAEVAQTVAAPAPSGPIETTANEYMRLKVQMEGLEAQLGRLAKVLKTELPAFAVPEIPVTYRDAQGFERNELLYLCPSESRSFDLVSAQENLKGKLLNDLKPFIKTVQTFELKAAENLIDLSKYKKYIETKKSVSLRVKKQKDEA